MKKISQSKLNVAKISSGTIIGQILSIVLLPFIARIYGVKHVGIWGIINATALMISSVSDLGMNNILMIDSDDGVLKSFKSISAISLVVSTLFGVVFSIIFSNIYDELDFFFLIITLPIFFFTF